MIINLESSKKFPTAEGPVLKILAGNDRGEVVIVPADFELGKKTEITKGDIFVWAGKVADYANKDAVNESLEIASIGEFEKMGIFVTCQTNDKMMEDPLIDVVEVEIDGMRVLYYFAEEEFDKSLFDTIGDIDVMVLNICENQQHQIKAVGVVDPKILIPVSNNPELQQKFIKELGIQAAEPMDKYKCRKQDFEVEEYATQIVQLKI